MVGTYGRAAAKKASCLDDAPTQLIDACVTMYALFRLSRKETEKIKSLEKRAGYGLSLVCCSYLWLVKSIKSVCAEATTWPPGRSRGPLLKSLQFPGTDYLQNTSQRHSYLPSRHLGT